MSEWYYAEDGEHRGPIGEAELSEMLRSGRLPATSLVWTDTMSEWAVAHTIPRLAETVGVAPPPVGAPMGYAGFWKRFVASILDGFITGVMGGIVGILIVIVVMVARGGVDGLENIEGSGFEALMNFVGIVMGWLYFAGFESSTLQATPGKMALGIRVTNLEGRRIGFLRATGRHFGKYISILILFAGFIMAGLTTRKQALHDMMAGCLVVNKR